MGEWSQDRVVDIRDWPGRPALRRIRPPRALRAPRLDPGAAGPDIGIRPATQVPVRSWPPMMPRITLAHDPVLLVACSESRMTEWLRSALPTVGVLQNLGGQVPRSPRAP
jgi:hypothetical protein